MVGLPDKELGKLFEEGGQVIVNIAILNVKVNVTHDQQQHHCPLVLTTEPNLNSDHTSLSPNLI